MPTRGLLDGTEEATYWKYHLRDAKDSPYAIFAFHYRSWESLEAAQLIAPGLSTQLMSASPSRQNASCFHESLRMFNAMDHAEQGLTQEQALADQERRAYTPTRFPPPRSPSSPISSTGSMMGYDADVYIASPDPVKKSRLDFSACQLPPPVLSKSPGSNSIKSANSSDIFWTDTKATSRSGVSSQAHSFDSEIYNAVQRKQINVSLASSVSVAPSLKSFIDGPSRPGSPDPFIGTADVKLITRSSHRPSIPAARDSLDMEGLQLHLSTPPPKMPNLGDLGVQIGQGKSTKSPTIFSSEVGSRSAAAMSATLGTAHGGESDFPIGNMALKQHFPSMPNVTIRKQYSPCKKSVLTQALKKESKMRKTIRATNIKGLKGSIRSQYQAGQKLLEGAGKKSTTVDQKFWLAKTAVNKTPALDYHVFADNAMWKPGQATITGASTAALQKVHAAGSSSKSQQVFSTGMTLHPSALRLNADTFATTFAERGDTSNFVREPVEEIEKRLSSFSMFDWDADKLEPQEQMAHSVGNLQAEDLSGYGLLFQNGWF